MGDTRKHNDSLHNTTKTPITQNSTVSWHTFQINPNALITLYQVVRWGEEVRLESFHAMTNETISKLIKLHTYIHTTIVKYNTTTRQGKLNTIPQSKWIQKIHDKTKTNRQYNQDKENITKSPQNTLTLARKKKWN